MPPRPTLFQTPDKKRQDATNNSLLSSLPLLWSCTSSGRPTSAHYYGDDDSSDEASHLYVKREYRSLHEMNDENSINHSSMRQSSSHHTNTFSLNKQQLYPYHQLQQQRDGRVLTNKEASLFRQKKFQAPNSPSRSQATATTKTSSISTVQESLKQRLNTRYQNTNNNIHRPTSKQQKDQQKQPVGRSLDLTTNTTRTTTETRTSSSLSLPQQISCNDDVSFLSFDFTENDDDDDDDELLEPTVAVPSAEDVQYLQHCKQQVSDCFERYGMDHLQTANAFYELGQAHVRCEQYPASVEFFKTARRIYESRNPNDVMRVAKCWDALGLAQSGGTSASADKTGLLMGLQSLRKCFKIRYDELGPWHIDTVETMNKMCNIYLKLRWYSRAKEGFMEVLTMRSAILGEQHPSVAVAAHSLGTLHIRRNETEQAKAYFMQALDIFALCGLAKHAFAERIREKMRKLGFEENRLEI